ncbi:hypothetical protein P152DRAFT_111514 [Eremomyces bilateralis CBS 781.70]|uniref:Uncharacterized protein n=1 Tax=Eremomyces bilateralis CBS 781.70 TaxID=1392243 RepID=A0A6G1GE17_9PEZI|nr:uncharacterized protein P152DRAFT_111514 [Eremomyces bilateralis CBS 781.70]KAF1816131.1 hypothetical protein P152DRAFT_111514 [Eremomyces bilateralis CBS 781.70]
MSGINRYKYHPVQVRTKAFFSGALSHQLIFGVLLLNEISLMASSSHMHALRSNHVIPVDSISIIPVCTLTRQLNFYSKHPMWLMWLYGYHMDMVAAFTSPFPFIITFYSHFPPLFPSHI